MGGSVGSMALWLEVEDVALAIPRIEAIVKQLGLVDRATIEPA